MTDSGEGVIGKRTRTRDKEALKPYHAVVIDPTTELCLRCGRPAYRMVRGGWQHERLTRGARP